MHFIFEQKDFSNGLCILEGDYGFLSLGGNFPVRCREGKMLSVTKTAVGAEVEYTSSACFFRAVSLLAEHFDNKEYGIKEEINFTTNGVMFDVSQGNAAPNLNTCKTILRRMAVMGLNLFMLYCEDSYTIPQYNYFGYMRAKYEPDELKELDDYAFALGIEIVPCIQTLAHLHEALKWTQFEDIRQDRDTLLVGEEATYDFIEAAITAASAPFRSRRIHIGMDESWDLGGGEYQKRHGIRNKQVIMCEHLARVLEITKKLGLSPMMWCDMFFRAAAPDGDYYSQNAFLSPYAIETISSGVDCVYWDYYHTDKAFYDNFIDRFKPTGKPPIFAGGVWSWYGFAVNWGLTYATMLPALASCTEHQVKEVFLTVWGDNGTESHIYANLTALSLFAEHGYGKFDFETYKKRFEYCCKADFDSFYSLRLPDEIPGVPDGNPGQCNCSKYLLWNDVLSGLIDRNIQGISLQEYYGALAGRFLESSRGEGDFSRMFRLYYLLCRALELKAECGTKLRKAYFEGKEALAEFTRNYLPELQDRVKALHDFHRDEWLRTYKHHGWDVLDMRYAAVEARIDTAVYLCESYISGDIAHIEELEDERLFFDGKEGIPGYLNHYGRICSASRIAPEH